MLSLTMKLQLSLGTWAAKMMHIDNFCGIRLLEGRTPVRPSPNDSDESRRQRTAALQSIESMKLLASVVILRRSIHAAKCVESDPVYFFCVKATLSYFRT